MSQVRAGVSRCPKRSGIVPGKGKSRAVQKMKNSGNEAKKYLKSKDIAFFDDANFVRFARKSALFRA
jgi:hypothetical protein